MARFKFRLERALRFALLRENQKKQQIAASLSRIRFLERHLERVRTQFEWSVGAASRDLHSVEAHAGRDAVVPNLAEQRHIRGLLGDEREALDQRQSELRHLSQRRRSLESLRDKRKREFRQHESRREQREVDEMASLKVRRLEKEHLG